MKSCKLIKQNAVIPNKLQSVLQAVFGTPYFSVDTTFHTPTHWAMVYKVTLHKRTLYQSSSQAQEKTYIVRLLNASTTSLEERQKEIQLTQQMADLGIAPKVYYGSAQVGAVVMEYIPAQSIEGAITDAHLKNLAIKLKRLHGVDSTPYCQMGSLKLEGLFKRVASATKPQPNFMNPDVLRPSKFHLFGLGLKAYAALAEILGRDMQKTIGLCHLDLNQTNLLWKENQVWLIDWDIADQGDVDFDLATVINTLKLNPAQEAYFLQSYFGHPMHSQQIARLYLMKQLSYLRYAITTFGLCTGYKILPVPNSILPCLKSPFEFASLEAAGYSKNMSVYMLALAFCLEAKRNLSSEACTQAIQVLNPHFEKEPLYAPITAFCHH